jgi:hypothetical protein
MSSLLPRDSQRLRPADHIYDVNSNGQLMDGYSYNHVGLSNGLVFTDRVAFGRLEVTHQAVGVAANVDPSFLEKDILDGVIGFGFVSCGLSLSI